MTQLSLQKKEKILCYEYARIWLTLLVLIGHCSTLAITSMDMSVNIDPYVDVGETAQAFAKTVMSVIYSFHMPAFMMLSGAVFSLSYHPASKIAWCKKRVKRLLLPMVMVAVLFLVPVRLLVGYYGSDPSYLNIFIRDLFLGDDLSYLWYLLTLFQINLIMCLLSGIVLRNAPAVQLGMLTVFGVISAGQFALPSLPFSLNNVLRYLFWFYVGILYEMNRASFHKFIKKYTIAVIAFIWIFAFIAHTAMEKQIAQGAIQNHLAVYKMVKMVVRYVMEGAGSLTVFQLAQCMTKSPTGLWHCIEKDSFSIYLYHSPLMMLGRKVVHCVIAPYCMTDAVYMIALIFICLLGLGGSIGIARMVDLCSTKQVRSSSMRL